DADNVLGKALSRAYSLAVQNSVSHLVVPCLGYNWEDNQTIDFAVYFDLVFDNTPASPKPGSIHLSLYSNWPTFALEHAVAAINSVWGQRSTHGTWSDTLLYRAEVRLTLLLLSICLLTSLAFTPGRLTS